MSIYSYNGARKYQEVQKEIEFHVYSSLPPFYKSRHFHRLIRGNCPAKSIAFSLPPCLETWGVQSPKSNHSSWLSGILALSLGNSVPLFGCMASNPMKPTLPRRITECDGSWSHSCFHCLAPGSITLPIKHIVPYKGL